MTGTEMMRVVDLTKIEEMIDVGENEIVNVYWKFFRHGIKLSTIIFSIWL